MSVGIPVYNGGESIGRVIHEFLCQSFGDFELIVSDNASTDATEDICREFAARDSRVRYFRQRTNIGAARNFRFVLDQARLPYFLWAAADDRRSVDFLAENVEFLEENPEYVASTCPNCFEGHADAVFRFALTGNVADRYLAFLSNCWKSHGVFYSVMRTDVIRECEIPGQSFTAADWAIIFFLASRGPIHRTERGMATFGRDGVSSRPGAWAAFRSRPVEYLLPLYLFSRYALRLTARLPWRERWGVLVELLRLNTVASTDQAHAGLYAFYRRHIKRGT